MSPNPKPSGNGKDTRYKGGKKPPPKELPDIVTEFSEYFGNFPYFKKTAEKIKTKYNIKEMDNGFWKDDDIKRVWGKTTRLNTDSKRRKTLSLVTMLEMLKKLVVKYTPSEETETQPEMHSNQSKNNLNFTSKKRANTNKTPKSEGETCYIRIPLSVMDDNFDHDEQLPGTAEPAKTEPAKTEPAETEPAKNNSNYKLIYGVPSLTQTIRKTSYVLQYNNHIRNATWVFEILNRDTIKKNASRRNNFTDDLSVHEYYRTEKFNEKITTNGEYNRGHLAAAGNHNWHQKAMDDTFLLSNISPQNKYLNRNMWTQLENSCREKLSNKEVNNVLVYTGPLYCFEQDQIKSRRVKFEEKAIPTHFFKVIIVEYKNKPLDVECYMIPNKNVSDLNKCKVELEDIEKHSGVLFSEKIPTIKLKDEPVTVRFKPPNENLQKKEGQNKEKQSKEGIKIELKVTPNKNDLFDSIG